MKFNKKLFIRVLILVLGFTFLILSFVCLGVYEEAQKRACIEMIGYYDTTIIIPTPYDWLSIPSVICAFVSAGFIGYWIFDVFIKP